MLKETKTSEKLVPLRKFAINGLYNLSYLSVLVQRKKLKARKVGRNYFTCRKWFLKYLEQHASDDKIMAYRTLSDKIENAANIEAVIEKKKELETKQPKLEIKNNLKIFMYKTAIISMAVFVLIYLFHFLVLSNDQGDVAGVVEEGEALYR